MGKTIYNLNKGHSELKWIKFKIKKNLFDPDTYSLRYIILYVHGRNCYLGVRKKINI